MNKILSILPFILISTLTIISFSCDKISEPYFQENNTNQTGDTVRKLLFEDFTGHKCVNCPEAHKIIEDLQGIYKDRIIVLAEHVGFFAKPSVAPFDYDFRTVEGTDIATVFDAISAPLPKGMVNRTMQNGSYLIDRSAYGSAVSLILDSLPQLPDIFIELNPSYNSTDSTISVDVKLTVLNNLSSAKYNLVVMITENNIVRAQMNVNTDLGDVPEILDYVHMNVLRGSINSTWGEQFADGSLSINQVFNKSYSGYHIGNDYNPDNIDVVAFVYYADGSYKDVVIQAEKTKLR